MEILFLSSLHLFAFSLICSARSSGADEQIVYGIEIAAAGSFMRANAVYLGLGKRRERISSRCL